MKPNLTATVADGLVALVLDGTYPPGSTLPSEADLATRFNVTRLTVREAIRTLAPTNLIGVRQGRSSVINTPDKWSPLDPRLLLPVPRRPENHCSCASSSKPAAPSRSASPNSPPFDAPRNTSGTHHHLQTMREAHQHADVDRFVDADLAFHDTLFTDRRPSSSTPVRTTRPRSCEPCEQPPVGSRIREHGIDWHDRILVAIRDANPDTSRETMRAHLAQTQEEFRPLSPSEQNQATNSAEITPSTRLPA